MDSLKKILRIFGLLEFAIVILKQLKTLRLKIDAFIIILADHSFILRKVYFFIFSKAFRQEIKMLVAAKNDYLNKNKRHEINEFLLRRNIHRIEKGILMESKKDVFAIDYIKETVTLFYEYLQDEQYNNCSLSNWAFQVLKEYFRTVKHTKEIISAKEIYEKCKFVPTRCKISLPVSYSEYIRNINRSNEFEQLVYKRKSIRYFEIQHLFERDKLLKAIEIACQAPSSCNRQPFRYIIVEDKDLKRIVLSMAAGAKVFEQSMPSIVLVIGQMNLSPSESDRHLMYIDASLSSMLLMLAVENLGGNTCPINWPDKEKNDKIIRSLFDLDKYERPIMIIAVGYANKNNKVASSERKTAEEITKFY